MKTNEKLNLLITRLIEFIEHEACRPANHDGSHLTLLDALYKLKDSEAEG